jgi:hypothetical protein
MLYQLSYRGIPRPIAQGLFKGKVLFADLRQAKPYMVLPHLFPHLAG